MSNFVRWCFSLSFTNSYHFQWPWMYLKVTVVSNSIDWKFYVFIWLRRNFLGSLSGSNRSWIYQFWGRSHVFSFKGDHLHISSFGQKLMLAFSWTPLTRGLSNCISHNLAQGLHWYFFRFDDLDLDLDLFSQSQFRLKHKLQIVFSMFLTLVHCSLTIVSLLHTLMRSCTVCFVWLWCVLKEHY